LPRTSPTAPAAEPSPGEPRRGAYYKDDGPGANAPPNLEQTPDAVPRAEPLHRFANRPYEVFGKQYVPLTHAGGFRERGIGSWYGRRYHGQRTSSGEPYDMYAMSAAHPTLPIPGYVRVTNVANGRSVVVRVNDRGPFHAGRIIDLSYTAALKLGYVDAGSALVEIESVLADGAPPAAAAQPAAPLLQPAAGADGPAGIFLQLGAFSARDNAESFRARVQRELTWLREAVRVSAAGGLFRLHLGPYPSADDARRDAERIRAELGLAPLLLSR
jgi:rare lipoprotein A